MASAPVFWVVFAGRGLGDVAFLLLVATAAAVVIVATMVATQSLAFWLPRAATLCEELFQMFLMVCFYPQHPFAFTMRLVLFLRRRRMPEKSRVKSPGRNRLGSPSRRKLPIKRRWNLRVRRLMKRGCMGGMRG